MSDPMDCSPPGSYVQGISQARILSGLTFPSPQDLRDPGIEPGSPTLVGGFLTTELPKKSVFKHTSILNDNYYFCYSGLFNLFIYTFVKCLFIFLNWSTVDLQYHVNFKYTAKRFSYMYKCISIYLSIYGASQVELVVKNLPANASDVRDAVSIPRLWRSPGRGHGNPLRYSCLENPMDRGAWRAIVIGSQRVRYDWGDLAHTYIFMFFFFQFYSISLLQDIE